MLWYCNKIAMELDESYGKIELEMLYMGQKEDKKEDWNEKEIYSTFADSSTLFRRMSGEESGSGDTNGDHSSDRDTDTYADGDHGSDRNSDTDRDTDRDTDTYADGNRGANGDYGSTGDVDAGTNTSTGIAV